MMQERKRKRRGKKTVIKDCAASSVGRRDPGETQAQGGPVAGASWWRAALAGSTGGQQWRATLAGNKVLAWHD